MHFFKTFLPAALLATTVVAAPSPEPEPKLRGKKVQGPATIKFVWCRYNNHQYIGWESCQATTYYTSPKSAGDKMVQSSRKSVIHPLYNWFRFLDIENKKERITSNWDLDNTVTFSYKPKKAWTSRKFITGAPDNVINTGPELMNACSKTLKDNGVKDAKIKELVGNLNLQDSRVFEYKNLPDVFDDKTKF